MIRKSKRLKMGKNRVHKQHKIVKTYDMVDHISNLPDCILHHILSLIPTKEVVKTSVLSTRWNYLWTSVPNIDFDDLLLCDNGSDYDFDNALYIPRKVDGQYKPEVTSFMNFIERVLRLRGASNIKKLHLTCVSSYDESQIQTSEIHSWISDAIMHNVQELNLSLYREDPYMIPWPMFDGTSLVSLTIKTYNVSELPSCISFPCLKTLHLHTVVFPNDDHVETLLLGCPIVEELVLSEIWMNLKNILISNSKLKSLTINDLSPDRPSYEPGNGCKVKIDAENLTYFKYIGFLPNEILLCNVSSLVKACIYIPPEWPKEVTPRVNCLLKRLQNVVSLRLSRRTLESLTLEDNMMARFPVFPNLSHLMLDMQIGIHTFKAVMDLLSFCPVLQSICFSEGFKRSMYLGLDENNAIWSSVPICISNCLKTVTFMNFHADNSEVCFLKWGLKYACVLERMDIWWSKNRVPDLKRKREVRKELRTLKKSSTACVIKFL